MAEREQIKKQAPARAEPEQVEEVPAGSKRGEELKAELDDLLDEIDEVLEATIASGFKTAQRSEKILRLTSSFSTAVSITRSQSASPSMVSAGLILPSASPRASSLMTFLTTCRDRLPLMVAMPDFRRSAVTSLSTTSKPANAATWAMPLPIWPEPITPTFFIMTAISSSYWSEPGH